MGVEGVVPLLGVYVDESKPYDLQLCPVMTECVPASKWLVSADNLRRYRGFVHLVCIEDKRIDAQNSLAFLSSLWV
jgi:hypothetical protein